MATSVKTMIYKLQKACNDVFGQKLLYNRTQVYSEKVNKPITLLCIRQAIRDEKTGKVKNVELFNTTTELYVLLFLRDYWYGLNGWDIPEDNEGWLKEREKYQQRKSKGITPSDLP